MKRITNEEILKIDEAQKKVFVVLNKKVEEGRLMNAVAHLSFGISAFQPENKNLLQYSDKNDISFGNISHHAIIVLKAKNSNQLHTLKNAADEQNIENSCFTETMTLGTSAEQHSTTAETKSEDHEFFGVCLFGNTETIQPLTKKFSLWG